VEQAVVPKSNSHRHFCYTNESKWREGLKTVNGFCYLVAAVEIVAT
jgi:hypothetical protein